MEKINEDAGKRFIGFSEVASEFGVCAGTLKRTILRKSALLRQLQEDGFSIENNRLPGKLLTPNQANLIRKNLLGYE
jgi:hypothetical protein